MPPRTAPIALAAIAPPVVSAAPAVFDIKHDGNPAPGKTVEVARASAPDPSATRVTAPTPVQSHASPDTAVQVTVAPTGERAAADLARTHSSCDDGDSDACLAARLDTADRRVAIAYDRAVQAGAAQRDLRDYRAIWNRARARAASAPRYALNQYGMIAADLDLMAQDAGDAGGWR